jgi:hypothetical protein
MNNILLEQIIRHILANLLVIPSNFISPDSKSILDNEYLLDDKLSFILENDKVISHKVWGCQFSANEREIKLIATNCSEDSEKEWALLVQLKDAPAYGIYLIDNNSEDCEPMIACSVEKIGWLKCNTYLQATFLAGMEQLKEIQFKWHKCVNYKEHLELLKSFIQYHDQTYGEEG